MTWNSGCSCGTSTEGTAVINRTISFYTARDTPTAELDQVIYWLGMIRDDCAHKISQIESLKNERERSAKHRDGMNKIARQFCDRDSVHLDYETRKKIVQQRLGCDWQRAGHIAEIVGSWAKDQQRKRRDEQIWADYQGKMKITHIGKKYSLSRQQIHNIINERENNQYFR